MSAPRRWILATLFVCFAAPMAKAQTVGVRHAVYTPASGGTAAHIELVFDETLATAAAVAGAEDKTKYRLVDLYSAANRGYAPAEIPLDRVVVPRVPWLLPEHFNTVQVFPIGALPAPDENRYILIVSGLSIGSKNLPVTSAPISVTMQMTTPTALSPQWGKAKDKDSADIYFSGSLSRSAGEDFYGIADVKIRYPLIQKDIGNRLHSFAPSFDLAASGNPDADPNSLRFGGVWQFFPVTSSSAGWPVTRWENALEHEASRDFDYRTFVWRSEALFLPNAWRLGDSGWFWVNPLVGIAAGRILEVPAGAFDEGSLFRIVAGANATLEVPTFFAKTLTFTGEYRLRRQFQEEIADEETLGRGTHSWLSAAVELAFNDFVSFGVKFQDGKEPPTYKDVNRSLTVDLTFKAARKNKPQ